MLHKKNSIRYQWMTDRERFLNAAKRTMLEYEIPKTRFDDECHEYFKYAKEKHISYHIYGQPTAEQRQATDNRVYKAFKRDLKALVYDLMPEDCPVSEWDY